VILGGGVAGVILGGGGLAGVIPFPAYNS
jgi:hypothetical protein